MSSRVRHTLWRYCSGTEAFAYAIHPAAPLAPFLTSRCTGQMASPATRTYQNTSQCQSDNALSERERRFGLWNVPHRSLVSGAILGKILSPRIETRAEVLCKVIM